MTDIIAYFISGVSTAAFFILWFIDTYKEINSKKSEVQAAVERLSMHNALRIDAKYGPNEESAKKMLEISHIIHHEAIKVYNETLHKPFYFIPGLIMGYRKINKEENG